MQFLNLYFGEDRTVKDRGGLMHLFDSNTDLFTTVRNALITGSAECLDDEAEFILGALLSDDKDDMQNHKVILARLAAG
jgi:hypothetical protein